MGKLSDEQIKEYFDVHLPVRLRTLLAHYRMTHERGADKDKAYDTDLGELEACYLASLVSGRAILNLVGIGKDGKGLLKPFHFQNDDIAADDLGGNLVIFPLIPEDRDLFEGFLKTADKAAAHFTIPINHPWSRTHEAILRIHDYARRHLYEATGRPVPHVWY